MRIKLRLYISILSTVMLLCITGKAAHAEIISLNNYGQHGLIETPSARFAKDGMGWIGGTYKKTDMHGYLGFQLTDGLQISLHQSAETFKKLRLYSTFPGMDFKLRLAEETETRPAIAFGVTSAIGTEWLSSEYFVASKQFGNFDVNAGVGWGRLGTAGHFKNPLHALSSHFKKDRLFSINPTSIDHWFTGDDIGLFGGVTYKTPIENLLLKAEYNSDAYKLNNYIPHYNRKPIEQIHLAAEYSLFDNLMDVSAGLHGGDRLMLRANFKTDFKGFKDKKRYEPAKIKTLSYHGTGGGTGKDLIHPLYRYLHLDHISTEPPIASAHTHMRPDIPVTTQLGQTAQWISQETDRATIAGIRIEPRYMGFKGPSIRIANRSLIKAARYDGSPQEVWHNTDITKTSPKPPKDQTKLIGLFDYKLDLQIDTSLANEEGGFMYRGAAIGKTIAQITENIVAGMDLRINIDSNIDNFRQHLPPSGAAAVRSDIQDYLDKGYGIDRLYLGGTYSFTPEWHTKIVAGWLEEMYAGVSGEILYRPFQSRFAFGAEAHQLYKRHSQKPIAIHNDRKVFTGGLNVYYDIPDHDLTLGLYAGRYLHGDDGATLSVSKDFGNGIRLEGYVTATNEKEPSVLVGDQHLSQGLRLIVPFGNTPRFPKGSTITMTTRPIGRNVGERPDSPLPLYETTEPISYEGLAHDWKYFLD